jgi:hypothetical protein
MKPLSEYWGESPALICLCQNSCTDANGDSLLSARFVVDLFHGDFELFSKPFGTVG